MHTLAHEAAQAGVALAQVLGVQWRVVTAGGGSPYCNAAALHAQLAVRAVHAGAAVLCKGGPQVGVGIKRAG